MVNSFASDTFLVCSINRDEKSHLISDVCSSFLICYENAQILKTFVQISNNDHTEPQSQFLIKSTKKQSSFQIKFSWFNF